MADCQLPCTVAETPAPDSAERATYRLLGNWDLRAFALAIGLNDFTTSSGTEAASEVFDSISLRGSGTLADVLSEA